MTTTAIRDYHIYDLDGYPLFIYSENQGGLTVTKEVFSGLPARISGSELYFYRGAVILKCEDKLISVDGEEFYETAKKYLSNSDKYGEFIKARLGNLYLKARDSRKDGAKKVIESKQSHKRNRSKKRSRSRNEA